MKISENTSNKLIDLAILLFLLEGVLNFGNGRSVFDLSVLSYGLGVLFLVSFKYYRSWLYAIATIIFVIIRLGELFNSYFQIRTIDIVLVFAIAFSLPYFYVIFVLIITPHRKDPTDNIICEKCQKEYEDYYIKCPHCGEKQSNLI